MRHVPLRFWLLAALLIAINASGWAWVHHAITKVSPVDSRGVRLVAALPESG